MYPYWKMPLFEADSHMGILIEQVRNNSRLRQSFDLRTHSTGSGLALHEDTNLRILNALLSETQVAKFKHPMCDENVIILVGEMYDIIYDAEGKEVERIPLDSSTGNIGCVKPADT